MFSLFRIELTVMEDGHLPSTNGHLLHGMVFSYVRAVNPEYSTWLHDGGGGKPFALAPLRRQAKQADRTEGCSAGDFFAFQIGVWEETLERCVLQAFTTGAKVRVGELALEITNVSCVQREDPISETAVLDVHNGFVIHFHEPTAFRSQGVTQLFPEPRLVFGSLSQKLLQATGEKISAEALLEMEAKIYPSRYVLHTCALQMNRFFITGFVGHCAYNIAELGLSDQCRAYLCSLLRIIPYTGIGIRPPWEWGLRIVL